MVDLKEIGLVKDVTMRNIESLCLQDVKDYSAADIVRLRKSTKLSQAAFAAVVNVSTSTQQKWKSRTPGVSMACGDEGKAGWMTITGNPSFS